MTLWYLARASGIVAMVAFTVATAFGAIASAPRRRSSLGAANRRVLIQYVHRSAAVMGLALVGIHVTMILLDSFANVPLSAVVLPMTSAYRPFAVTLGALTLWSMLAVAGAGALRRQFARGARLSRLWRTVHTLSYVAWALMIGHALTAGSEAGTPAMTALVVGCVALVSTAAIVRLHAQGRYRRSPLSTIRARLATVAVTTRNQS
jgi:methionine sulfoxide reductase heme-binding subunit